MDKKEIALLFRKEEPVRITEKESSHGEEDFRLALFVEYPDEKLVIKLAGNSFTDEEHLTAWMTMAEKYKELGYYCPQFIKALDGTFPRVSYENHDCIAYAEEYSKYRSATELAEDTFKETGLITDHYYTYLEAVVRMNARVAAMHYDFTELPSAYAMFELFCAEDEVDETMENALNWKKEADKLPEKFKEQAERIWSGWEKAREELKEIYDELPTSVFQADINESNVLLDEEGNFKGVYDFNIGGKEVFVNLICREAPYVGMRDWTIPDAFAECIKKVLQFSAKDYEFNELEKKAVPLLYKCIRPLYFLSTEQLQQAGDDEEKIQKCLDDAEWELNREIDFFGD